jgi:hypothetical protein
VLGAEPVEVHASVERLGRLGRHLWARVAPIVERLRRATEPAPTLQAVIVERLELRNFPGIEHLELDLARA